MLWRDHFPCATVNHLLQTSLDHLPVLLNIDGSIPATVRGHKQFRFEAIWVQDNTCQDVIRPCWDSSCGT